MSNQRNHHGTGASAMSALIAVVMLVASLALLLVPGGVLFAPFGLGLSMLALVAVFGGLEDRSVRQRDPALDPHGWRDGS